MGAVVLHSSLFAPLFFIVWVDTYQRLMQCFCCFPIIEVYVRWGAGNGPPRLLKLQRTLLSGVSPSPSVFLVLPHPESETARRFTACKGVVVVMTSEREGLFHIRLVCPWKLMAGGSFALDMQSLETRAAVGSLT